MKKKVDESDRVVQKLQEEYEVKILELNDQVNNMKKENEEMMSNMNKKTSI